MEKAGKERHAGIPEAVFVVRVWTKLHLAKPSHLSPSLQEDVDAYMRDEANSSAEVVLKRFDEQRNKYKFLEANLKQKKQRWVLCCGLASLLCCDCLSAACTHRLKNQIPDIQKTLDMVLFIKNRQARLSPSVVAYCVLMHPCMSRLVETHTQPTSCSLKECMPLLRSLQLILFCCGWE